MKTIFPTKFKLKRKFKAISDADRAHFFTTFNEQLLKQVINAKK